MWIIRKEFGDSGDVGIGLGSVGVDEGGMGDGKENEEKSGEEEHRCRESGFECICFFCCSVALFMGIYTTAASGS